ncbi:permease [Desulfovibrio sp. OttesenSCG-928-C06]|nr:permease [Desulfovibrio sp. OttesenSCG-928-C06]
MTRTILRLMGQGVMGLSINPWAQFLTLSAVVLVSFLVGLMLMAITTLDYQLSTVSGETSFQVYWRPGQSQDEVIEQWQDLVHLPGFLHAKTYTPEQALREMEKKLGRNASAKNFSFLAENNPLPATAILTFAPGEQEYDSWFKETMQHLWGLPGVEQVTATPLRDELGQAWRKVNNFVMRPAIVFLTLLLGLVVGNTVRLALLAKSHEVEILQMVGAFNWYIRLPLLVCGAIQGLAGSALALVILRFIHMQIHDALNFPPLLMEIRFLPLEVILLLLAVPTVMGVVGGWVGMRR